MDIAKKLDRKIIDNPTSTNIKEFIEITEIKVEGL
jgi:hypothetical protein